MSLCDCSPRPFARVNFELNQAIQKPVVVSGKGRLSEGNNTGTIPGYNVDSVMDPVEASL